MSSSDKQSIIVRVEVELPAGMTPSALLPSALPPKEKGGHRVTQFDIPAGVNPSNVRVSNGVGYICAKGSSTNSNGDPARHVFGKVYAGGTTTLDTTPPVGSRWAKPNASGKWSFEGGDNLEIPEAHHNVGGTAANILRIWADYGTGGYEADDKNFLGKTSTVTDCSGSVALRSRPIAGLTIAGRPLQATFLGALATLGCVALHWNGVYWMGMVPATGAHLSFFAADTNCTLGCTGEGVAFVVAGPPASSAPFSWSAEGTVSGKKPGGFGVIVTE